MSGTPDDLFKGVESTAMLRSMALRPGITDQVARALEALADIRAGVENGTIIVLPKRLNDVPFGVYKGFVAPWTAKEAFKGLRSVGDTQAEALYNLANAMPPRTSEALPISGLRSMTAPAEDLVRSGKCPECNDREVNSSLTKLNDDGDADLMGYQCGVCKNVFMISSKKQEGP